MNANAQSIRIMGYSSMSHTSWWSAQNDKIWAISTHHQNNKVNDHTQSNSHTLIILWYDQAHKVSHTYKKIVAITEWSNKVASNNQKIEARHSLSKPNDLYTFSPFGNKLPKSSKMHSAIRHSRHDLRELRKKSSHRWLRCTYMAWRWEHLQTLPMKSVELEVLILEEQLWQWL